MLVGGYSKAGFLLRGVALKPGLVLVKLAMSGWERLSATGRSKRLNIWSPGLPISSLTSAFYSSPVWFFCQPGGVFFLADRLGVSGRSAGGVVGSADGLLGGVFAVLGVEEYAVGGEGMQWLKAYGNFLGLGLCGGGLGVVSGGT